MPNISLTPEQKRQLENWAASAKETFRRRACLLMAYDSGQTTRQAATEVGLSLARTRYWRRQFILKGMDIFNTQNGNEGETAPASAPQESGQAGPGPVEVVATQLPASSEDIPEGGLFPFPERMEKPGMQPEDTMAEAGRKVVLFHFAEMVSHEGGVRQGKDPDELHDMRVATRRMRAAFDLFSAAFKEKALAPHIQGLRKIARRLGRVRDLDVIIGKAIDYCEALPEEKRTGLDPLIESWQQERDQGRISLLKYMDGQAYRDFKDSLNSFLHSPGQGVRSTTAEFPAQPLVRDEAPALIYSRLAAVRSYETILPTATLEEFHALRIQFKKLRYAVEFFSEVLGPEAKKVINVLKENQDHLGDLNDARVACQMINDFLEKWETRQRDRAVTDRQSPEPIVEYLAAKHAERYQLMLTYNRIWGKFIDQSFKQNLAMAIAAL